MKTYYSLTLLILGSIFFSTEMKACITPPDSVGINIYIDTTSCEAIIELTNLRIMGAEPNQFCSCGVNSAIGGLGEVVYLAFVDSLTNEPISGFDQFSINSDASAQWDLAGDSPDWNGFVSSVNFDGLQADQAVKLWIHLNAEGYPNGCNPFSSFDIAEIILGGALGTDEWDGSNNVLSDDHQGIAYFWNSTISLNLVTSSEIDYFDDIIYSFYNSIEEHDVNPLVVYPNPVQNTLNLDVLKEEVKEIVLMDAAGRIVLQRKTKDSSLDISSLPRGMYALKIVGLREEYTTKIVVD